MVTRLLEVVPEADRSALLARMRQQRFAPGEAVFQQGDHGNTLYIVQSGRFDVSVTTTAGHVVMLRVVHPGELFGELALVHPDARRSARVCALERSEALALSGPDFERLRDRHPQVDRFLVAALADRLMRTNDQAAEMLLPPDVRVWRRLAVLADAYGDDPIRMSQDLLAHAAGTVRQTANRVLRDGVHDGVIAVGRGTIRVIDAAGLGDRCAR